jgi:hypothetical protein
MRVRSALLAIVALAAAAWFGLGAVQAIEINRATARLVPGARLSRAEAGQVRRWLATAAVLDPDRSVTLLQGRLLVAEGRLAAARRLIGTVTRAEPQNLEAWVAMAAASADDPAEFKLTLRRVRALVPLLPGESQPHQPHRR